MKRILIIPVGLYVNRVEKSIVKLKPDSITLVVTTEPSKNERWKEVTKENCKVIMEDIDVFYEKEDIKVGEITVDEYSKSLVGLWREIHRIREKIPKSKIWIDVTSAPKAFTIAAALVTTFFKDVILRYVPSKKGKNPDKYPDYLQSDPGNTPQEWYLPRTSQLDDLEKRILVSLDKKGEKVKGSEDLLDELNLDHSKSGRIKLGRLLSKIEKKGLITQERLSGREKIVELTEAGKALASVSSNVLEKE